MLADIILTTHARPDLLRKTLESLRETTDRSLFRITIVQDSDDALTNSIADNFEPDYYIRSRENEGLGPALNRAFALVNATNQYYDDPQVPDPTRVAPFVCFLQDDLIFEQGWLGRLTKMFLLLERQHHLGFASGLECVEHAVQKDLGNGILLKQWVRMACLLGRRAYVASLFPIPRFDPEVGGPRAKPDHGVGSGVDWWLVRNHPGSICRSGRTCLVIPGLVRHSGYATSTWLNRELPESESDKSVIQKHFGKK